MQPRELQPERFAETGAQVEGLHGLTSCAPIDRPEFLVGQRLVEIGVRRGENAPHGVNRGGREGNLGSAAIERQFLDDLGRVAVSGWLERADNAAPLWMM